MSEHQETIALLRDIVAGLERIEAKIGQAPAPAGEREVLSLSEAAGRLGVRFETARELVESGQIAGWQDGTRWRVPRASLRAYIEARRFGSAA